MGKARDKQVSQVYLARKEPGTDWRKHGKRDAQMTAAHVAMTYALNLVGLLNYEEVSDFLMNWVVSRLD
jgi:hypothetical protein